jgi:hypothetical protein
LYTVQALHTYFTAFQNDPNTKKSQQVVDLATQILLSIAYSIRPNSFTDLIYFFLNFTYRTNYFKNPVTADLINTYNSDITTANTSSATQVPLLPVLVPTLPNPNFDNFLTDPTATNNNQQNNLNMNNEQLTNLLTTIFGEDGQRIQALTQALQQAAQDNGNGNGNADQPRELNIVKVEPFYGREDEDPYEWLDKFNTAAVANRWPNDRRIPIAAGYLKEAALEWA